MKEKYMYLELLTILPHLNSKPCHQNVLRIMVWHKSDVLYCETSQEVENMIFEWIPHLTVSVMSLKKELILSAVLLLK
jgi:hypothetical protein